MTGGTPTAHTDKSARVEEEEIIFDGLEDVAEELNQASQQQLESSFEVSRTLLSIAFQSFSTSEAEVRKKDRARDTRQTNG